MSTSSLLDLLKSLFAFNRPWSHLRPLVKALQRSPYDLATLEVLNNELTKNHREIPMSLLWRIWRLAEQARATGGDAAATPLLEAIERGVLWEVQTNNRAM